MMALAASGRQQHVIEGTRGMADLSERIPNTPITTTTDGHNAAYVAETTDTADTRETDMDAAMASAPVARRGGGAWEIVETLLVALLLFFGMRQIVPSVEVDGMSMVPSLQNTQRLLVNRLAYVHWGTGSDTHWLFHPPQRGDIIVLNPPPRPIESFWDSFRTQFQTKTPNSEPYIKRIIGLPGDTVLVTEGKVFLNGTPITENYIKDPPDYTYPPNGQALKLGPDQYLVFGDNRRASADGHFFGPIPSDRMIGKAWVSIWPWNSFGFLPHRSYPMQGNSTG